MLTENPANLLPRMLSLSGFNVILLFMHLASGGPCDNVVTISSSWPGGLTASLNISITTPITSWEIDLKFSSAIPWLKAWDATESKINEVEYQLRNLNSNGVHSAGTTLTSVGFNAFFSSSTTPIITSVVFNGDNVCLTDTKTEARQPIIEEEYNIFVDAWPTKYNYIEVITKSLLFYYAQRSGRLPKNDNPIPYRSDSALNDRGQDGEDLTGGYYDAGDHLKLGFPLASSITIVAWSIIDYPLGYSSAGKLTTARNMVKWATDYFIKAHVQPNKFNGQVGDGDLDHDYWGRPEEMTMSRPAFFISTSKPGSDLAGETAAALAAASIVFKTIDSTYSALCLTHAKQLYDFAKRYRGIYSESIPQVADFYSSSGFGDELAWGASWLYRATNDNAYLEDAKAFYTEFNLSDNPSEFSWDTKTAGVQVLLAKLTNENLYRNAAQTFCDSKVEQPKTPKGLLFVTKWGSLGAASNIAFICLQAADLNINPLAYRQLAQQQIHYALGDTGRSFVVGFGHNPPLKPHHASSSCPNRPAVCDWDAFDSPNPNPQILYGALVGGPNNQNDHYVDDRHNFVTNEVACDYNAGFQASVAALQSLAVNGIFN